MGYLGKKTQALVESYGRTLEIVKRPRKWFRVPENVTDIHTYLKKYDIDIECGFKVLPRRWVVERTFAWIGRYRRFSKDYEYLCEVSETLLFTAMIRTMLKRVIKL
jgi:putative transposase